MIFETPNTLLFDFDIKKLNRDSYNGYALDNIPFYTRYATQFRNAMMGIPRFWGLYDMRATIIKTVDVADYPGDYVWADDPAYSPVGRCVVVKLGLKSRADGNPIAPHGWMGLAKCQDAREASQLGIYFFHFYGAGSNTFRMRLIDGILARGAR